MTVSEVIDPPHIEPQRGDPAGVGGCFLPRAILTEATASVLRLAFACVSHRQGFQHNLRTGMPRE